MVVVLANHIKQECLPLPFTSTLFYYQQERLGAYQWSGAPHGTPLWYVLALPANIRLGGSECQGHRLQLIITWQQLRLLVLKYRPLQEMRDVNENIYSWQVTNSVNFLNYPLSNQDGNQSQPVNKRTTFTGVYDDDQSHQCKLILSVICNEKGKGSSMSEIDFLTILNPF